MSHRGARGNHGKWKRKRQDSFSPRSHDFPLQVRQSLEPCFNKVFSYNGTWQEVHADDINNSGATAWQDSELQAVKAVLNDIKSQLNDYDINAWHEHTCAMNPAGLIINTVKKRVYPELCTQAWCKLHEILCRFDVIRPAADGTLNTLHLCEAPGAFVTSLNHYVQTRHTGVLNWQWTANTLNPHFEGNEQRIMIADDRFIRNTMDNWHFGGDNTGNIMSAANIRDVMAVSGAGSMHLVTADGSICCANNPAEQESQTAKLHYCELVAALNALTKGGSFVLKMFTMFEESSISLMYLLNCTFEHVRVFKPCSSKPGNSEVYIVALGFKSVSKDVLERLFSEVNESPFQTCILRESAIPEAFRTQHRKCCRTFFEYQTATIQENRSVHDKPLNNKQKEDLQSQRQCCAEMYITKCSLSHMASQQRIVPRSNVRHHSANPYVSVDTGYLDKGRVQGSYVERQNCSRLEKLKSLPKFDVELTDSNVIGCLELDQERFEDSYAHSSARDLVMGKKIERVHSSRFCDQHLLSLYTECLQELAELNNQDLKTFFDEKQDIIVQEIAALLTDASLDRLQDMDSFMRENQHLVQNRQKVIRMNVLCNNSNGAISKRLEKCIIESEGSNKQGEINEKVKNDLPKVLSIEYDESTFQVSDDVQTADNGGMVSNKSVWQSELAFLTNKDTQIQVLNELHRLVDGDHVVVTLPIHVTRFANSVLFILSRVFQTIKFVPSHFQSFPTVTVVCLNFMKVSFEKISDFITRICKHFEESDRHRAVRLAYPATGDVRNCHVTEDSSNLQNVCSKEGTHELLQFVPIQFLYLSPFYSGVSQVNDKLLQLRINQLLSLFP